jgi:hypothetical protein
MDKEKRALSKEIDVAIALCALGEPCDEAELVRLAIEYATRFHCPYQLSAAHMRSLETDAERARALQLEVNVNNVIRQAPRRAMYDKWRSSPGMAGLSRLAMERFTDQPKPLARELVRTCKCTTTCRSPRCKMPSQFCKHTSLAKAVPRRTKSLETRKRSSASRSRSASPSKTRKSHG